MPILFVLFLLWAHEGLEPNATHAANAYCEKKQDEVEEVSGPVFEIIDLLYERLLLCVFFLLYLVFLSLLSVKFLWFVAFFLNFLFSTFFFLSIFSFL